MVGDEEQGVVSRAPWTRRRRLASRNLGNGACQRLSCCLSGIHVYRSKLLYKSAAGARIGPLNLYHHGLYLPQAALERTIPRVSASDYSVRPLSTLGSILHSTVGFIMPSMLNSLTSL
jgi:hypothetical protein